VGDDMAYWTCFKCGKIGLKTIDELTDEGWQGFDLRYGTPSKRLRKFSCPEHREEFKAMTIEMWKELENEQ